MFPVDGRAPRRPARREGRRRLRPLGRLHRLHVRDRAGATGWSRAGSSTGRSSSAATSSRRSSTGHDRSHLRPLRRRRRRGRARAGRATAASSASSSAPTARAALELYLPAGGSRLPATAETVAAAAALRADERPRGLQVRDARPRRLGGEGARTSAASTVDDVDVYVPHQANVRIIDHATKKLGYPGGENRGQRRPLRQHVLRLDPARARRRAGGRDGLQQGELVLMTGMGAGLTWGSALIEWTANGKGGQR